MGRFLYDIRSEQHINLLRYAGPFTLDELLDTIRTLWTDPRYSPAYDGIVDLTEQRLNLSLLDMRSLVDFLLTDPRSTVGRWAVVATSPLATACSMLYKKSAAGRHECQIFSTWEGASAFIFQSGVTPRPTPQRQIAVMGSLPSAV